MKYENFKQFLLDMYPDVAAESVCEMFSELKALAQDEHDPISDVVSIVDTFKMDNGLEDDNSAFEVLEEFVDILDNNAANANRLYELIFDAYESQSAIDKLALYNFEYLTEDQKQELIPLAEAAGLCRDEDLELWRLS